MNPWDNDPIVSPGAAPGPVFGAPKPMAQPAPQRPVDAARDEVGLTRDTRGLTEQGLDIKSKQMKPVYDRAGAIDKVRDGVRQDKRILAYESAVPIWASALKSPDNAEGDLMLVNAMAKVNDPSTGVQQREGDSVAGASPALDQMKATLLKQFGSDGYGNFTPEGRKRIRQVVGIRMEKLTGSYRQARDEYRGYIKELGLPDVDAEAVIGPHAGTPFQQDAADSMGRAVRNADGSLGPAPHVQNAPAPEAPEAAPDEDWPMNSIVRFNDGGMWKRTDANTITNVQTGETQLYVEITGGGVGGKPAEAADPTMQSLKAGVGDIVEGVGDFAGLVANPLNAGINWATGSNLSTDLGQSARDATGLPQGDPLASAINKGATTALTGAGIAGLAARGLTGVAGSVAETVANQPIQQGVAGATSGASTEAARRQGFGPGGQAVAGLVGGLTGYAGANSLAQYAERSAQNLNPLAQAAQRQNVRLMPADQGGDELKNLTGAAAKAPLSAGPIIKGSRQTQGDLGTALDRTANSESTPLEMDEAGNALRKGLEGYGSKQGQRLGRIYDRADSRAAGVTIKPVGALGVIDEQLARLGQLGGTNAPLIKSLQTLRKDIAGGVKVSGMRDARTSLSQGIFDGKLRSSQEQTIYKQVVEAISTDIEAGLSAAGRKDALNLFRIADKGWKERIDYIDGVLEPLIGGNKSGEDILRSVESMTRGGGGGVQRLAEVLRELPADQAHAVRSTIIERMGRATANAQDETGVKFSAGTFMTNWSKMTPKGKAMMFGSGELRRNLDDIAKLASATKETGKFANFSNTAGGIWGNVGALAGMATLSPKFAIIAGITQFVGGRAMASPALTRWLARMPENGAAQGRYADQLKNIATREPLIANDIKSIQNFLQGGSIRAAASPEEQDQDRR